MDKGIEELKKQLKLTDEEIEQAEKTAFGEWEKTPEFLEALKNEYIFRQLREILYRKAHIEAQLDKVFENKDLALIVGNGQIVCNQCGNVAGEETFVIPLAEALKE